MSGAFGWVRNDRTPDPDPSPSKKPAGYDDAAKRYQPGAGPSVIDVNPGTRVPDPPSAPRVIPRLANAPIPGCTDKIVTTAPNVLIVVMDATGSMNTWPEQVFKFLPLLHGDAVKYLGGQEVEILFMVVGDAKTDTHPLQVGRLGKGPELDGILASLRRDICDGGGNGGESHELAAVHMLEYVDTSSARNVHAFFITDEPPFPGADLEEIRRHLGITVKIENPSPNPPRSMPTDRLFARLRQKMQVHAILCETGSYDPRPIIATWKKLLGDEGVIRQDDQRRVVDVMLGALAAHTGQIDRFTQDLKSRQLGTKFGNINVQNVLQSIALIGRGTPSSPQVLPKGKGFTKPLLAAKAGDPDDDSDDDK